MGARRREGRMVGVKEHRRTERKSSPHGQQLYSLLIALTCVLCGSTNTHAHTCAHDVASLPQLPLICLLGLQARALVSSLPFFLSLKLSIPSFVLFWFFGSRKIQDLWRTHCNVIWRELYNSFPPLSTPQDWIFIIHARKKEKKQLGKGSQLGWSSLEAQVSLYWALCLVS